MVIAYSDLFFSYLIDFKRMIAGFYLDSPWITRKYTHLTKKLYESVLHPEIFSLLGTRRFLLILAGSSQGKEIEI